MSHLFCSRGPSSNNGSVDSISSSIEFSLVHISDDDIPSVAADRFGGHQGGALQTLQTALLPNAGDACFLTRRGRSQLHQKIKSEQK